MSLEFDGEFVELGDTERWCCICGKCATEWPLLVLDMLKKFSESAVVAQVRARKILHSEIQREEGTVIQSFKKILYLNDLLPAGEQKNRV